MSLSVSFVSCYIDIYDSGCEPDGKTHGWRMFHFMEVARTGVPMIVYVCSATKAVVEGGCEAESLCNVCVIEIDVSTMFVYSMLINPALSMPERRTATKDTREYMALMNSKAEFVKDAVLRDPHGTTHFAWLDFSFHYMLREPEVVLAELKSLCSFVPASGLFVPGCWKKRGGTADSYCSYVRWRFCGTFFVGDKASLLRFYDMYVSWLPVFVSETGYTTWEVNIWEWFESNPLIGWSPIWYGGDHNDSLIMGLRQIVAT